MPYLHENDVRLVQDHAVAEMMKHVTPDPETEEENSVSDGVPEEEEPSAKKPKTALGKLLCSMFSEPTEKRQLSIREKAEQKMKRYQDEPVPHVDENVLEWWKKNESRFPTIGATARRILCIPV